MKEDLTVENLRTAVQDLIEAEHLNYTPKWNALRKDQQDWWLEDAVYSMQEGLAEPNIREAAQIILLRVELRDGTF